MVEGGGFEPPKLTRQIYNLLPLATREPLLNGRKVCRKALLLSTVFVNFISYYKHLDERYHFVPSSHCEEARILGSGKKKCKPNCSCSANILPFHTETR